VTSRSAPRSRGLLPLIAALALNAPPCGGVEVTRLPGNPIVRPEMLPGREGDNIDGPSLIRAPSWLPNRLGRYYLYFAHHQGHSIRLAYADELTGPWTVHAPGTLRLDQAPGCRDHVASPDAVVDETNRRIRLYFHCPAALAQGQKTFVAVSRDGLRFAASPRVLGIFYWRVFRWRSWWYAMAKGGLLYRAADELGPFEPGPNPFPGGARRDEAFNDAGPRHVAVQVTGDALRVYYSNIGDAPERILRGTIALSDDWSSWRTSEAEEVLRPLAGWEGAGLPLRPSSSGPANGRENAVRDPAIFVEDGTVYLLYSVAGESGIAIARVRG
jgi:hypothetical protein